MSDYVETLWNQFVVETEEHLELIEPLLVQAEYDTLERGDVDQLFRSFHSIKGLSKAMDLIGMESIAHRAEDLLGLVRDDIICVDAPCADLLLAAVDALKQHHRLASTERKDKAPLQALIDRLIDAYNKAKGGGSIVNGSGETATPQSDTPPNEHSVDRSTPRSEFSGLHDDADMVLFYCEMLQSNLPKLEKILDTSTSPKSPGWSEIVELLESIIHATNTMGFLNLAEQFREIKTLLPKKNRLTKEKRKKLLNVLMDSVCSIRFIEQTTTVNCGINSLVEHIQLHAGKHIEVLLNSLNRELENLTENDIDSEEIDSSMAKETWAKFSDSSHQLIRLLNIFEGHETAQRLLRTFIDISELALHGNLNIDNSMLALLRDVVITVQALYRNLTKESTEDPSIEGWQSLQRRIWELVYWQNLEDDADKIPSFSEIEKIIKIDPQFEESLSLENLIILQNYVEGGDPVYQAFVKLEESESFTSAFLEWIEKKGVQVLTNRPVTNEGVELTEFLFLSTCDDHELRESLKLFDPARKYINMQLCSSAIAERVDTGSIDVAQVKTEVSMLRVSGETLDHFMSQIGEMVSIRGLLNHNVHSDEATTAVRYLKKIIGEKMITGRAQERCIDQLEVLDRQQSTLDQIDRKLQGVLSQLQDDALALRVVPMETVFKRFPRSVRDLAQAQGKQVKLEIIGQDVRIDKAMVEVLSDPLMHMVRNSVDHGIETAEERVEIGKTARALVALEARQQGNTLKVMIRDDGRGINLEAVRNKILEKGLAEQSELQNMKSEELMQYIFAPGFSTAAKVTETSGRGVGMDVVRTNVTRMGGNVSVTSEIGEGSCFTLELPLSAAIQDTLLVKASSNTMAIPERYVAEMIEVKSGDLQWIKGCQAIVLRGSFLPIYRLGPLLGYRDTEEVTIAEQVVAVISDGKQRIGLMVDRSYQRQELFVKDIHDQLASIPGVSGASILGNGRVVLILDVEGLLKLAARRGRSALVNLENEIADALGECDSQAAVMQ